MILTKDGCKYFQSQDLPECKRHTAHRIASARHAVLVAGTYSGGGYLPWWGGTYSGGGTYPGRGVPTLVGGVPTMVVGQYLPRWGGTYPRGGYLPR